MTLTPDLLAPPLARMMRSQRRAEAISLSYNRIDRPDRRAVRGSRLADGFSWALAAWAEIMDLEPLINHRRTKTSAEWVHTRPWRKGKESAWFYLTETAKDPYKKGAAIQMLDNLKTHGIEAPCLP